MIQLRCNRCNLVIPSTTAHVVQANAMPTPGLEAWHWHLDCWAKLVAENEKRKAENSNPKV